MLLTALERFRPAFSTNIKSLRCVSWEILTSLLETVVPSGCYQLFTDTGTKNLKAYNMAITKCVILTLVGCLHELNWFESVDQLVNLVFFPLGRFPITHKKI